MQTKGQPSKVSITCLLPFLRDEALQHLEVAREFFKGHFVVHKSCKEFSSIATDQAHKQTNAVIKDDGGVIDWAEGPTALQRWMIAGPEVSRPISSKHHEQGRSSQITLFDKVEKRFTVFKETDNPFEEESAGLLVLDTTDIAYPANSRLVTAHHSREISSAASSKEKTLKENCHLFSQLLHLMSKQTL